MNLQIEMFSTPTVEGRKIISSKGFVCANVVLGAGVISDAYNEESTLPSYVDTYGVEPYHSELFETLEEEVLKKEANAVIDLHIEHSYVHRGDSYYLLISAQGTAVVLEGNELPKIKKNLNINSKVLEQQIIRKQILKKLKAWQEENEQRINEGNHGNKCYLSADEWEFICRYADVSFADYLQLAFSNGLLFVLKKTVEDISYNTDDGIWVSEYSEYFVQLPHEKQMELAYKYYGKKTGSLISKCCLFDAKHILEWVKKGEELYNAGRRLDADSVLWAAICRLKACKREYSIQDLEDMQNLYNYCSSLATGIKGKYAREIINSIEEFGLKVETLRELLSRNG